MRRSQNIALLTNVMNKHIALDEKLAVIQEADTFRKWFSLDDRRVCVLCDRVISGRMIDVWEDKRGVFHLHCPTPGCTATPRDWFHHGAIQDPTRNVIQSRAPMIRFGLSHT